MSLRSEVIRIFNELVAAGKKITELPAADPLSGSELLEIVQDGDNRKVSAQTIANLGGGGGGGGAAFTIWVWASHANQAPTATAEGQAWVTSGTYDVSGFLITDGSLLIAKSATSNSVDPDPSVSEFWIKP